MIFYPIFVAITVVLIILTNATSYAFNLPNPLLVQIYTNSGSSNLFFMAGHYIFITELAGFFLKAKNINDFYCAIYVGFIVLFASFGISIAILSQTNILLEYPHVQLLGFSTLLTVFLIVSNDSNRTPLGSTAFTVLFILAILVGTFIGLCQVELSTMMQNKSWLSLGPTVLMFWPKKPFALKNIFNELSGDNALNRNNLQQNPKASTQCKC